LSVFFDAVAAQSEARSRQKLLVTEDGAVVTHGAALRRSAQMAGALRGMGLKKGDRVAAMVEKSAESVLLYLACLQAGLVYVPINPGFRAEETAHVLTDATPAIVVCMPGQEAWFDGIVAGTRAVALGVLAETDCAPASGGGGASGDPAVILYTSGTTGRPKGAVLSQANILANGTALSAFWRFAEDDVLLHVVPLFHSHGLFVSLSCTLLSGSALLLIRHFAVDQAVALLPACSVFMGVPTMYGRMVAHPGLNPGVCRGVRLFACGSAPLSVADDTRFTERSGQEIVERYGMSETAVNTSNPLEGKRLPGSVGIPLPGVEVRIADDIGAVQVRGAHVFGGYWNQPAQTAAVLRADGWFDTGDLGRIDEAGYLTLVGRAKDLIISGGYNVYSIEVERVLQAIPGVADVAVVGLPHRDYGEAVTAFVVQAADASLREAVVIAAVKERLAAYKAPKRVVLTDTLPRNAIGKVQKNVLQQRHAGLYNA
jgi:malonyl-CoA/methylmalonyl-CoA synthetase